MWKTIFNAIELKNLLWLKWLYSFMCSLWKPLKQKFLPPNYIKTQINNQNYTSTNMLLFISIADSMNGDVRIEQHPSEFYKHLDVTFDLETNLDFIIWFPIIMFPIISSQIISLLWFSRCFFTADHFKDEYEMVTMYMYTI